MLTISDPLTMAQVATYHQEEFASNQQSYYKQGGEVRSEWRGPLAAELGLAGAVTEEQVLRLAGGQHPQTGEQLTRVRGAYEYTDKNGNLVKVMDRRAGFDLTVSFPKPSSLAALVGKDERIREAARRNVDAMLEEVCGKFVQARMGGNRPAVTTGKWVAAVFEHDVARPVDGYAAPQLHFHCLLFNLTQTEDRKFRAIEPLELYRSQTYGTAVLRAEHALDLQRLGYEVKPGEYHEPAIQGFTKEYLEASSQRRAEIDASLKEQGLSGAAAAQIAAHRTRDKKLVLSPAEVFAQHRELAAEHGNQPQHVVGQAVARGIQPEVDFKERWSRAGEAVTWSRERNFEREAVTAERLLMRDALKRAMGYASFQEVKKQFEQRVSSGEFVEVRTERPGVERQLTTRQTLEIEAAIIGHMRFGKDLGRPLISPAVKVSLEGLSESQGKAVSAILQAQDRIIGLEGKAGVGKSFVLRSVREAAERDGYRVEGFAPTSRAAKQLRESGLTSCTLQKFLVRTRAIDSAPKHLYVLDESSLVASKMALEFFNRLSPSDRVLLVGNRTQHQAVDSGKPFEQLQGAGMYTVQLSEIVRQKTPELRAAVEKLSNWQQPGQVEEAIKLLAEQGRIHELSNINARLEAIAEAYSASPEKTLVVSPDNETRMALNSMIQEKLQAKGLVSAETHPVKVLEPRNELTGADRKWAASYEVGDVLRYSRGSKEIGLKAGEYATVARIDPEHNVLTVSRTTEERTMYSPARLAGVSVYREVERQLAVGARIQFTAPDNEQGIANRDLATVQRIKGSELELKLDDGRSLELSTTKTLHLDHGYASTSHSAQSATVERVLLHVDTAQHKGLVNSRLGYVGASRGALDIQVYTDSLQGLPAALGRDHSKTSALNIEDYGESVTQKQEPKQSVVQDQAQGFSL